MPTFADCSTNVASLTAAQICEGFSKCGTAGIAMNSAGFNAVVQWLEGLITSLGFSAVDCDGNPIASGASLATCQNVVDAIAAAIAALPADKFLQGLSSYDAGTNTLTLLMSDATTVDVDLTGLVSDAVAEALAALDYSVLIGILGYVDCNGDPIAEGAAIATCDDLTAAIAAIPAPDGSETKVTAGANVTVTGTGTPADPYIVSATGSGGGGGDGNISNVTLTGTNLVFTGSGGGFNGSVNLSSLIGGDVTGVTASAPLVVTNSGGPNPDISIDMDAIAAALCANVDFQTCIANKVLDAFSLSGGDLSIADGVDASGNFTFTAC